MLYGYGISGTKTDFAKHFCLLIWVQERNVAAVKIQRVVRKFLQKRRAEQQSLAATTIQAAWRGHAVRNRLRREREAQFQALLHKAATVIQVGGFCIFFFFNISKMATVL